MRLWFELIFVITVWDCDLNSFVIVVHSELDDIEDSDDSQEENLEQDAAKGGAATKEKAQKQKGKRKDRMDDDDEIISKYGLDDYDDTGT